MKEKRPEMARTTFERYLEAIYETGGSSGEVRVKDIAATLGVSNPSVSEMVDRLVENGLVTHDKYQRIVLTAKGRRIASGLDRKHEVVKSFLRDVLDVDEGVADREACEIEHVISDSTLDRLTRFIEELGGQA